MPEELRLTALDRFTCLRDRCPDNCCRADWDIRIDPPTLDRWQRLPDEGLREWLHGSLVPATRDGEEVMLFKRNAGGACVHLTETGLCGLQLAQGAEMLPGVCRDYPRLSEKTADRTVHSATLSCPEIARLVLFDHGDRPVFEKRSRSEPAVDPIAAYLGTLTEKVLDQKKYPPNVKLLYLGKVLADLALSAEAGTLDETHLRETERGFKQELFELNVAVKNGRLRPHPVASGAFWRSVYRFGATCKLFTDVADSPLMGILGKAEGNVERYPWVVAGAEADLGMAGNREDDRDARYTAMHEEIGKYRSAARALLDPFRPALENYLRAALVNRGFPWNPVAGNYIAAFMAAAIPFAAVYMLLWIKAVEAQGVTRADVEEAVYKTERRLFHSTVIYDQLDKQPELLRLDRYLECLAQVY